MSQIMGAKIRLELVEGKRCRMLYQILLNNQVIGDIALDQIAWRSGEAELKIEIFDHTLHNLGYGTDAVVTLLRHAFLSMNLSRVYLRVHADNGLALGCYEKAGFQKKGRLRRLTERNIEEEILLMAVSKNQFLLEKRRCAG